ncbi:MAG TPA: response regulator [Actinomycetota bacterium]|jgi:diguanylate cyclase (GGDEF)-like protein|nr:response regulator [Actinomycetota bacterium]
MTEKILVVDDDPDIARFVELNLRTHGYETHVAADGQEALDQAFEVRPDLVLLDVTMPKMDGFEVAQRLRADPRTSNVSIIMLTARALSVDKVLGLTAGADDYVIKPCDPVELVARVKGTLRRAQEMRALSPLTGLPGNMRIQEELHRLVSEGASFALLYADLDNFKAYNDHYGFLRGDEAIRFAALCLQEQALAVAGEGVFIGHVGGDDFVIVCAPDQAEELCRAIIAVCTEKVPALYDEADRQRGHIEVENRRGETERYALFSISIGVATTDRRTFSHHGEAVAVATELKEYAKREQGSSYAVDRRGPTH